MKSIQIRRKPKRLRRTRTALKPREQRRIQSIEVGFRLVRALAAAPALMPLTTLAAAAGMPPSKAHLYLVSFVREGLVERDSQTGHYGLGLFAMQLGLAKLRQFSVIETAKDLLTNLWERTHCSVFLSVWANRGPSIVFKIDGDRHGPIGVRVGHVLPLLSTSTGRVFLAFLPGAATAAIVAAERAASRNLSGEYDERIKALDVAALADAVRRTGFAHTDSRMAGGLSALSAPVLDHEGKLCAATTLLGPEIDRNAELRQSLSEQLRSCALEISARLGYATAAHDKDESRSDRGARKQPRGA